MNHPMNPEPDDFFYGDADIEQAQLEAAGLDAHRRNMKVRRMIREGRKSEAAAICTHGWSGRVPGEQLKSGRIERCCYHCGSRFYTKNDSPVERAVVLVPCEFQTKEA